jgi:hypothetical protein
VKHIRTRQEIEDQVDELAYEAILKHDPDITAEEAQSMVWEEVPELYDEYLAAPSEPPARPIAKAEREPTLGEEIHSAVRKRAAQLAWTEWPTKSIEDLEWEVWRTPEGQALYSLYTSPEGRQPMSDVEHKFTKRSHANDAWAIFQSWRAG